MEKYTEALVNIHEEEETQQLTNSMDLYMDSLKKNKIELLDNLRISPNSIGIAPQNKKNDENNTKEGKSKEGKLLKYCLIQMARQSLAILSQLKNVSTESIIVSNAQLFEKKNTDYGNSFVDFGLIGIIVRLNDKINRILNLGGSTNTDTIMQVDEKIEDTINDLYNYCIIGLMYT